MPKPTSFGDTIRNVITGNTLTMQEEENTTPEQAPEQEPQEERTLETETEPRTSVDPLDQLSDVEALRLEAKKLRAIANRVGKKGEEPPAPETEPRKESKPFLTEEAFHRANEKKAIRVATTYTDDDPEKDIKAEIEANFDRIKAYYTPRHGKDTPEDILEDIKDAHAVWKRREYREDVSGETVRSLTSSTVTKPAGATKAPPKQETIKDRWSTGTKPEDWYQAPKK